MPKVYVTARFLIGQFTDEEVQSRGTCVEGWGELIDGKEILFGEGEVEGISIDWR